MCLMTHLITIDIGYRFPETREASVAALAPSQVLSSSFCLKIDKHHVD